MVIKKMISLRNKLINSKMNVYNEENEIIEVEFSFNNGVTNGEIEKVEKQLKKVFPNSFKNFLKYSNGCKLFNYEELDGFKVLEVNEIIKANNYLKNTLEEDWDEDLLVFCKYIGEDNYISFKYNHNTNDYNVVDCFTEELPEYWNKIAKDFDEFMSKLIDSEGRKYWLLDSI
ncbi:hypothetical protein E4V42_23205 [Clostridium estertheticum]|uniref:Knr4/Smi1-like domain-containing protein n=1 Tax=Clostridium estertheticum TaxID=238834 RepID=A0A5N7J8D6_9CLOT|nr:SMI1/KNR4 family protein [Clostridium estertheticum]MPQ34296.1 hypothetical protein [Clostridium estertheticum]MPQ64973.1 hypothetical protein [Clostridium estertheticum]